MQELFEQLSRSLDLIGRAVLSESTLTRLIGGDAAGSNLARYVHREFRVADQAEWSPTTIKAINWKMFSLDPQNLLLIKGSNGWVFLKPVAENFHHSWATQIDRPDEEEASISDRTGTFEYYWAYGDQELDDAGIAQARQDLESARHLRYGNTPNKNKYTEFPYVEKSDGIVKSRARAPKEILADIIAKLHNIERVWVAMKREDTSSQKAARDEYRKNIAAARMSKEHPDLNPMSGTYGGIRRKFEPNLYQGKMAKKIPPGASIEVAKIRNRGVDPELNKGKAYVGAPGFDNLIAATRPLASIIARRAMIAYKRKNRGNIEDPNDDKSLHSRLRRMNSTDPVNWWESLMGWKMPYGLAGKIIKSKNKQTIEYVNQLINGNNTVAKQWFVDTAVDYLLSGAE